MNDLRLHQTIFANSTCYFNGEILEICKTTLKDAITDSNGDVRIKLGAGHNWGCIPTRERSSIIANESDIRPFIEKRIENKNKFLLGLHTPKILSEQLESGKMLLFVENERNEINLTIFEHDRTYSSLSEGKTIEFRQKHAFGYRKLKLKELDMLPHNVFNNIEDAIQCLEKMIINEL
jgi:hypothetical protein